MGRPIVEIPNGTRFTRLSIIGRLTKSGRTYFDCLCDCGTKTTVSMSNLRSGQIKSCGCYKKEGLAQTTHGQSSRSGKKESSEYTSWRAMRSRCLYPKDRKFNDYGGRGIQVCHRWAVSFENFLKDMGPKPTRFHTIERIDVNGNYEPSNCKWVTRKEQRANQRWQNK